MTANHSPDAAINDADLVRYLDGELDERERERVEDAVSRDAALSARLEHLRVRSARFSALLTGADPELAEAGGTAHRPWSTGGKVIELNAAWAAQQGVPARLVPPPRALPGWLRAAAIVVALLGVSLFVPPVRAWLAGLLQPVRAGGDRAVSAPGGAPVVPVDTLGIRFESAADAWTIEFASAPAAGTLTVEWAAADSVTAERYSEGGDEELVLMSDGLLRVRNGAESRARYRVVLPAHVTQVTVRVPGRADVVWQAAEGSRTLDLGTH